MDKIPWGTLGPVISGVVVILIVVFVFIIKMKNGKKPDLPASGNPETLSKKSLCFDHEGRIKGCEVNIGNISTQFKESREDNRKDHKDLFEKIDEMGKDIIRHLEK